MKLSADTIYELLKALDGGLRDAGIRGLSAQERASRSAAVKESLRAHLSRPDLSPQNREILAEMLELADAPLELERRQRERYYSQPEKQRNRNLRGQKMALNDTLSCTPAFSPDQRKAIDERLQAAKLPSLRQLEIELKGVHLRLLKRGKIRTEEEYYLVQEVLTNVSFPIPEEERARFENMAANFEGRRSTRTG